MSENRIFRRDSCGRFAGAEQLDLRWWPERPVDASIPIDRWREVLDRAGEAIVLRLPGRRPRKVLRFEAWLLELASDPGPARADLVAAIKAARTAAYYVERADALERDAAVDEAYARAMDRADRDCDERLFRYLLRARAERKIFRDPMKDPILTSAIYNLNPPPTGGRRTR